ncbi:MAG: DUF481 domain-containing protein [Planctomycetota bacterium]
MLVLVLQMIFWGGSPTVAPREPAIDSAIQKASFQHSITSVAPAPPTPSVRITDVVPVAAPRQEETFEELEEFFELDEFADDRHGGPIRTLFLETFRPTHPSEELALTNGAILSRQPILGSGDSEVRVIEVPKSVISVMMGPVREANLLLPKRLDPFNDAALAIDSNELVPTDAVPEIKAKEPFNLAKQRELLGISLASRQNVPEKDAKWKFFAEAGGSFRQGNTSNTNIHSLLRTERHSINADIMGRIGVTYNRNGDDDTNRNILGEGLIDRNLRGRWVLYGRENLEYDEVRLINIRTVTSSGLGFKFINRLTSRLIVRTGPTISYISYAPSADTAANMRSGWLLESDYRRLLGESARVEWTCSAFPDFASEQEFRIRNEAALLFPIGGKQSPWNWKLGVRHDYQVNPVDNTRASDVEGYFSIAYTK